MFMRLFIAAELPDCLVEALAETQAELRAHVSGRYVGSDQFHVTLAFFGQVEQWRIPDIQDVLEQACTHHSPIQVQLGELGSFGRISKATLWQGFAKNNTIEALARDVRNALAREGIAFDEKKFLPHITLMRNADLRAGELPMPIIAQGTLSAITLFSSDLSGAHPVYRPVFRVRL